MPTYPLATLGVTISATGISAPAFSDVINSLVATFQGIYGSDAVLTPDSQDYQLIAAFAQAINDENNAIVAAYNNFNPNYAQGAGLSSLVLINGITRLVASYSTATLSVFGVYGTNIPAGVVQDANGYLWNLPANTLIGSSGVVAVTATCQTAGAISAPPGTITTPVNQVLGWQSVTNPIAAVPGAPVETDAALRTRRSYSTGLSALTPLQTILAAVAQVPGVDRVAIYENNTRVTNSNGQPGNSVSLVVYGGNITAIAQAIEQTINPGTGTYGSTSVGVTDPAGVPITINFFQLTLIPIYVSIAIKPLTGYVSTTPAAIQAAIVNFVNNLPIGETAYYNWFMAPAQLDEDTVPLGQTFVVTALYLGTSPAPTGMTDIPIAFNQAASCALANVFVAEV